MTELLSVENLRVRFRVMNRLQMLMKESATPFIEAVSGVSFDIAKGETLGLIGESGSGKSTIARTLMGLLEPSGGEIIFQGSSLRSHDNAQRRQFRRHVAMMFQDPIGSLSPRLTVRSLLLEPFRIHAINVADARQKVSSLLAMVGLAPEFAHRYPHQLSGGQARRVGVARALALNPDLVIADEPTAGLDVSVQGEVLNLLSRLQDDLGIAILIITHNLHVVRHLADRIAIMYLGRFMEVGPTEEIFARPRHPYTEALLSASLSADPDSKTNRIELSGEIPSLLNRPKGCEFHTRCPYATEKCRRLLPEVTATDPEGKHVFRCHHPLT